MTTLKSEVVKLKARIERLEATVQQLTREEQHTSPDRQMNFGETATLSTGKSTSLEPTNFLNNEDLLDWLKTEGLIVKPPPIAYTYAECWQTLSAKQKQAVQQELNHLPPGPMASDIIIKNRH